MMDQGYTYFQGFNPVQPQSPQMGLGGQGSFYPQTQTTGAAFQRNGGTYDPNNGIAPGITNGQSGPADPTEAGYLDGGSWFGKINPQYFQGGNLTGISDNPFLSGLNSQQLSQLTHNLGGNSHNIGDTWNQGGMQMGYGLFGNGNASEYTNFMGNNYMPDQYQAIFDQFNQNSKNTFSHPAMGGLNLSVGGKPIGYTPQVNSFQDIYDFAQSHPAMANSSNDYFKSLYQNYGQPR